MIKKLVQAVALLPPSLTMSGGEPEYAPNADDELFRAALFKKLETTSGVTRPAFDAFCDSLTAANARGDVGAGRAVNRILQHRQRQDRLATERAVQERSPVAGSKRKYERLAVVAHLMGGLAYLAMLPKLKMQAETAHGPFDLRSAFVPYSLDLAPACKAIAHYQRRERRRQPKGRYRVGYCKPPVATRFNKQNNPANRRKVTNTWDVFDRSLDKPVIVTLSDGSKVSSTRRRSSYDQLIRAAIRGERAARTEVVRRILVLSGKGLLSPPPQLRRARRKPLSQELQQRLRDGVILIVNHLVREMDTLFATNLGSKPDIVDYEYEAKVAQEQKAKKGDTNDKDLSAQTGTVTGAEPANAKRTGRRGAIQAAASKKTRPVDLQNEKLDLEQGAGERNASTLVIPTRPRTLAVPPARTKPTASASSNHPTLLRARVSVAKAPVVKRPKPRTSGGKP